MSVPIKPVQTVLAKSAPTTEPVITSLFDSEDETATGQIITLYGEAGTGKTTAALSLPGRTLIVDLENSTKILDTKLKSLGVEIHKTYERNTKVSDYDSLFAILNNPMDGFDNIVIDSFSVVMEYIKEYTFAHEKYLGDKVPRVCTCVEDYGFKSFPSYAFKCFPKLWNAIDALKRNGKVVVCVCHDAYETVPVGDGSEYKMFVPDAFGVKSGRDSIRHHIVNNSDQVIFLKSDTIAGEKKSAVGSGAVYIYAVPMPYICAKSRSFEGSEIVQYTRDEKFPWGLFIK